MAEMKGIKMCGECGNYDYKKHRCRIGCNNDSNAQASFYGDCPLPDVVPKSEVEHWKEEANRYQTLWCKTYNDFEISEVVTQAKSEVAIEIFEEIEKCIFFNKYGSPISNNLFAELKKKYTEVEHDRNSEG